jgi:predicted nucleic acid-binding Zn ribbon protein
VSDEGRRTIRGGWPVKIGEILGPSLGNLGPRVWTEARLRKAWVEAVGEQVSNHAQVRRLRGNVLEVSVTSDAWATELTYLAASVIERLNAALGDGTVAELIVQRRRAKRP